MQMQDKIIINDHIENDPLSEENLDKTLNYLNKFRLLFPQKTIWLYSGYKFTDFFLVPIWKVSEIENNVKRQQIITQCDVMVDGKYIDSQRDIMLKWRGSNNQRVISVQESLQQNKIVLYCN